jgi:hypothetical protein
MPKKDYYKKMFFIAALYNWGATLPFAVGYKTFFPLFNMELPRYLVFFMMFLGLCFVFGIGYFWVSRDVYKNHDIVWMGIIGKLIVFVGLLWAWMAGEVPLILTGPGIIDMIFVLLFIEFLTTVKKAEKSSLTRTTLLQKKGNAQRESW